MRGIAPRQPANLPTARVVHSCLRCSRTNGVTEGTVSTQSSRANEDEQSITLRFDGRREATRAADRIVDTSTDRILTRRAHHRACSCPRSESAALVGLLCRPTRRTYWLASARLRLLRSSVSYRFLCDLYSLRRELQSNENPII